MWTISPKLAANFATALAENNRENVHSALLHFVRVLTRKTAQIIHEKSRPKIHRGNQTPKSTTDPREGVSFTFHDKVLVGRHS